MIWLVVLAGILVVGAGFLGYAAWFTNQAAGAFAYCQVAVLEQGSEDAVTADVTLVGTPRTYRLLRLTYDLAAGRAPLPMPGGFEIEANHELGPEVVSWIPASPVSLRPRRSVRFTFPFKPSDPDVIRVTGWIEAKIGVGGSATFFHVPVGVLPEGERITRNLESRVRAEAVSRSIRPVEHEEWEDVERRRAAADKSDTDASGSSHSQSV